MTAGTVVGVTNVDRIYRGSQTKALAGVTLDIGEGEVFGLLGPNGAGKTTLIKLICGVTAPTAGTVRLWGGDPRKEIRAIKSRIGVVHQEPGFEMMLSVRDNLEIAAAVKLVPRAEARRRIPELLEEFDLAARSQDLIFTLSGGQFQRLAVVRALLGQPDLLILDEPSAGLDVEGKWKVWNLIHEARATRRATVVWTSHDLAEIEKNCTHVGILRHGTLVLTSRPADLVRGGGADVAVVEVTVAEDLDRLLVLVEETPLTGSKVGAAVQVAGPDLRHHLAGLLTAAEGSGIAVAAVRFRQKTLEDVFVEVVRGSPTPIVEAAGSMRR